MSAPPLLNLLGVSWNLGAPVVALAWNEKANALGFALGDGHLAVVNTFWQGAPRLEPRPGGGVAVVAALEPAASPVRIACHPDSCICLTADGRGGFLTGGDDGRVVQVPRVGAPEVLAHLPGQWVDVLAHSVLGVNAYASGREVKRIDKKGESIELPAPATALAFSPDGSCLAAAHSGGVTLWSAATGVRQLAWPGYLGQCRSRRPFWRRPR